MAALGELIIGIASFIFEMLVWSFVGFYGLCRALVSRKRRAEIRERWMKGRWERTSLIVGALLWIPVLAVGVGLGLPLAYRLLKEAPHKKEQGEISFEGKGEFAIPHPEDASQQLNIHVDLKRLPELKETKDFPDLLKRWRQISDVTVQENGQSERPGAP